MYQTKLSLFTVYTTLASNFDDISLYDNIILNNNFNQNVDPKNRYISQQDIFASITSSTQRTNVSRDSIVNIPAYVPSRTNIFMIFIVVGRYHPMTLYVQFVM